MVDHVVDPEALRRLLRSEAAFALAVDSRPQLCDLDEATKVLQGRRVVAVRRELDVGGGRCRARPLRRRGRRRRGALPRRGRSRTPPERWLGEGGEIEAVDLEGLFWIDVDTPDRPATRRAHARLPGRPQAAGRARLPPRQPPLSGPISLAPARGVSRARRPSPPFFALAAAAGSRSAVRPAALVLGGILVQAASILDGVDGEIARASLRESPFGGFLDSVLDRAADAAVLAALAVAAGLDATTWALLAAALGSLMTPYVKAAYEAAYRRPLARPISVQRGRDVRLLVASSRQLRSSPSGPRRARDLDERRGRAALRRRWRATDASAHSGAPGTVGHESRSSGHMLRLESE